MPHTDLGKNTPKGIQLGHLPAQLLHIASLVDKALSGAKELCQVTHETCILYQNLQPRLALAGHKRDFLESQLAERMSKGRYDVCRKLWEQWKLFVSTVFSFQNTEIMKCIYEGKFLPCVPYAHFSLGKTIYLRKKRSIFLKKVIHLHFDISFLCENNSN